MSKIIAYTALLYGLPYFRSSIRSVIDYVDEFHVLYALAPSHGTVGYQPCPDHQERLLTVAQEAAGDKLRWHSNFWHNEGQQRDSIHAEAPDADLILIVDSDEIWLPDQVEKLIDTAKNGSVRQYLSYEMPFWRSFHRAIPVKLCAPTRAINTRNESGSQETDTFFAHLGYAQPTPYIAYKQSIHGHRADWRPDWYEQKWLPNAQEDVHPTNRNFWNVQEVNPLDYLPAWMADHPYFNLEVIP